MMKKGISSLVLVATLALLALLPACAAASASDLDGTSWMLQSYGKPSDLIPVIENTNIPVDFAEGVISGSTGCNAFEGTYEVEGDALTIHYETSPGPRCDLSSIVEQEQMFLSLIVKAESYAIDGDTLTIDCGERVLVLRPR
ncbi:MAG: META domain-containing protein [Dehalococcoidia bacterium]|nr:META domain-containing protein [Dehalococcoidia bacterium]